MSPQRTLLAVPPTPLVSVSLDDGPTIWCKLEFLNPSGSTKDRIARYILGKAWRQGLLRPGDSVVEASSGSTSIAMALACAQLGLGFLAVMPEGVSNERVLIIKGYGGEVRFTSKVGGVRAAIAEAERLAEGEQCFSRTPIMRTRIASVRPAKCSIKFQAEPSVRWPAASGPAARW